MNEIVKSFLPDVTPQQIAGNDIIFKTNFATWHRMIPFLEKAASKRDDQEIVGIIAHDTGIVIVMRDKKPAVVRETTETTY